MNDKERNKWWWIPSLFFTQGLPFSIITFLSIVMYKRLGLSNAEITLYTGWLFLPWVLKALWSPVVAFLKTHRYWIIAMELLLGFAFASVAFSIPTDHYLQLSLAFLWLAGWGASVHDIAIDGMYMEVMSIADQNKYGGIRNVCFRLAIMAAQGLLVAIAGRFEMRLGNIPLAWSYTFGILSLFMILSGIWHRKNLPYEVIHEGTRAKERALWAGLRVSFVSFFQKKDIGPLLAFLLCLRLGESQALRLISPFLLDLPVQGGLYIPTTTIGTMYSSTGLIGMIIGGLLCGYLASRQGLKKWMWSMWVFMNIPALCYGLLALSLPDNHLWVYFAVFVEQFSYTFSFTVYLLYLIYANRGPHQTTHFAISTGFMAIGIMLPGMVSGWFQEMMGYNVFFFWTIFCSVPAYFILRAIKVEDEED